MGSDKKRKSIKNRKYKNGYLADPLSLTWSENYSQVFDKYWRKLPDTVGKVIATLAVFILGISINGDWVNIFVHLSKQFGFNIGGSSSGNESTKIEWSLEYFYLKNLWTFLVPSYIVSYALYYLIGGFLHWFYYVRKHDKAEEWKCQPKKWLPPDLERHEILMGSFVLGLNASLSGILACYVANGGYSTIYYDISEYGWIWFVLQWPAIFIFQDYITYWFHRVYHLPFLYKNFHKVHHKYKQPTAFSVTALHPVESLNLQLLLVIPIFTVPVHWFSFYMVAIYTYYHGIIDHSGINFKAFWWQPWQPDAIFHDNHHQYFHVNFAFNIEIWDKIHGTYRQKNRVYTENIFYGKGKKLEDVSVDELKADIEERESENPLAYRDNKLEYKLSKAEIKQANKSKPSKH